MRFSRASGILLHPTSLPGPGSLGALGEECHRFLESLDRAGQRLWQVLPLGPTGYGDSPYQSPSAFAGNPLLISTSRLVADGFLDESDLGLETQSADSIVRFEKARSARREATRRAFANFGEGRGPEDTGEKLADFTEREASWLTDYALFMALKEEHGGGAWTDWPGELRERDPKALDAARGRLQAEIDRLIFEQYLFFDHWSRVRAHAAELDIAVIGDLPIFVAADSADVWANPDLFELDEDGRPTVVAGVPPDYFSETGQLWGNPLYRWDVHRDRGFGWWIDRLRSSLSLFDRVRIDHFRGFYDYWEIPATNDTAIDGRWVLGPGASFFEAVQEALGELPVLAEDLGDLHEDVFALRDQFALPGMRVLQFGFAPDAKHDGHSPHGHISNCVAYTGTHDNDTTRGWFDGGENTTVSAEEHDELRNRVLRYTGTDGTEIHWDLIRLTLASVADTAVVPLQDVLGLGSDCRMNVPGTVDGNWRWRLREGQWNESHEKRLAELVHSFGR